MRRFSSILRMIVSIVRRVEFGRVGRGACVSVSRSSSLMSVSVYISQLLADESEIMDETRLSGRLCAGRLSLTHFSMPLSWSGGHNFWRLSWLLTRDTPDFGCLKRCALLGGDMLAAVGLLVT